MSIELLIVLLIVGAFVGLLAGLLGIGGGLVVVPALMFILPYAGISEKIVIQLALATSLATIIVTSASSALSHFKLGNVDFYAVKWLMPGVIGGGFLGATIADWIPNQYLPKIFGVIVLLLAIKMYLSINTQSKGALPSAIITTLWGGGIGIISSLAGIGGGSLSVPFLNRHGVEMRKAVGSSSICGFVIALSGMVGFIVHGFAVKGLPQYSIGYVYLPALFAIASTSIFTTRIGAKLAVRLSTSTLKKVFSIFLMFVSASMLLH
ncbi:sulfite exporter TauE/SafE family protein [Vibrio palustris]|uniref:Probable membrane transporter protein n=1 Tax=Vibrio palustris TaxID=1918946 RepID=A0A1R4B8P7_9VIBR|nr:sulfite exporter TauE/SafE family protein [Vibrio palustris]SJL85297.1 Sulfite exporter TauE/SafE [Vibrio palustris]